MDELSQHTVTPDGRASVSLPLCVDMDETLLRVDTLHEAAVSAVFADWRVAFRIPGWLMAGKARLKQELAERWTFDASTLPYSPLLLRYLREEHAAGRRLILCTAAHRGIAEQVARHLGLFEEVIATDGDINLRGASKAEELCRRFGQNGFVYVGNDATDHAVWDRAAGAVVANAPKAVRRTLQAQHPSATILDERTGRARALLRALRPYQWVKNALCLVPPIAAGDMSTGAWAGAVTVALAFCLVASGIYVINDIADLGADRAHARKWRRPFASGDVPIALGLALSPLLLLSGMVVGWASGALGALIGYLVISLSYNMGIKQRPLVDVFALAGLYTIRLFGGGEASGHPVSLWLLAFSSFLFLSLALIKRVSELQRLPGTGDQRQLLRRGYRVEDLPLLMMFGCAATFTSTIVLSLYVQSETALFAYRHPGMLWWSVPLLLFWQCRLWLSTTRGQMHDDPIVYAARDRVSWMVLACLTGVVVAAWLPVTL